MNVRCRNKLRLRWLVSRLLDVDRPGMLWALGFIAHFVLSQAVIFPLFYQIHPTDEMGYLYAGRLLMNGLAEGRLNLVPFGRAPLVMLMHAVTYAPVHKSLYWVSLTSWGSRTFLFALLWGAAYLVSERLRPRLDSRVLLAALVVSPVIPRLLDNSSDALFAGISGLALWQALAFHRTRRSLHLAAASALLGLAALTRSDGLVLFLVFLTLSTVLVVRRRVTAGQTLKRALSHLLVASLPFVALIAGYIGLFRLVYGGWQIDTSARAYFAFEQAEGVAYSLAPQALVDGVFEARRLYGSPEQNDYSVVRAIQNNPQAFMQRLLHLPASLSVLLVLFYGGTIAIVVFVLAASGAFWLLKDRQWPEMLIVLVWPAHLLVYIVYLARGGYLLTQYISVLALAVWGLMSILRRGSRTLIASTGALAAVLNSAFALALEDNWMLVKTLFILGLTFLLVFRGSLLRLVSPIGSSAAGAEVPALAAIVAVLAIGAPYPGLQLPTLGSTPEEQTGVYLTENFPRHAVVASHMPAVVFMAKMQWRPMVWDVVSGFGPQEGRFREFALDDSNDLANWLAAQGVDAIYMDDLLKQFRPGLYELIEGQIGRDLVEVFAVRDDDPARAEYLARVGISAVGWHRIVVPIQSDRSEGGQ